MSEHDYFRNSVTLMRDGLPLKGAMNYICAYTRSGKLIAQIVDPAIPTLPETSSTSGSEGAESVAVFHATGDASQNTHRSQTSSKAESLANLMRNPTTYDKCDSAWRLAMWLMMVENGITINTYENIALCLGDISKSSVRKWADTLVVNGVIGRTHKGNQVELKLLGDYMACATAPAKIHVMSETLPPVSQSLVSLRRLIDSSTELGGTFSIRIDGIKV